MITETILFGLVVATLAFLAGHRFGRTAGFKDGFTHGERSAFQQGRQAEMKHALWIRR